MPTLRWGREIWLSDSRRCSDHSGFIIFRFRKFRFRKSLLLPIQQMNNIPNRYDSKHKIHTAKKCRCQIQYILSIHQNICEMYYIRVTVQVNLKISRSPIEGLGGGGGKSRTTWHLCYYNLLNTSTVKSTLVYHTWQVEQWEQREQEAHGGLWAPCLLYSTIFVKQSNWEGAEGKYPYANKHKYVNVYIYMEIYAFTHKCIHIHMETMQLNESMYTVFCQYLLNTKQHYCRLQHIQSQILFR